MIKKFLTVFGVVAVLAGLVTVVVPVPAYAQSCQNGRFLTFPNWYDGLPQEGAPSCSIKLNNPRLTDFWIIAFNLVEMLIQALAYFAVGYILWGGVKYIKSQGEPGKLSQAKSTILYAMIGLGVALASVAMVRFIQSLIQ